MPPWIWREGCRETRRSRIAPRRSLWQSCPHATLPGLGGGKWELQVAQAYRKSLERGDPHCVLFPSGASFCLSLMSLSSPFSIQLPENSAFLMSLSSILSIPPLLLPLDFRATPSQRCTFPYLPRLLPSFNPFPNLHPQSCFYTMVGIIQNTCSHIFSCSKLQKFPQWTKHPACSPSHGTQMYGANPPLDIRLQLPTLPHALVLTIDEIDSACFAHCLYSYPLFTSKPSTIHSYLLELDPSLQTELKCRQVFACLHVPNTSSPPGSQRALILLLF